MKNKINFDTSKNEGRVAKELMTIAVSYGSVLTALVEAKLLAFQNPTNESEVAYKNVLANTTISPHLVDSVSDIIKTEPIEYDDVTDILQALADDFNKNMVVPEGGETFSDEPSYAIGRGTAKNMPTPESKTNLAKDQAKDPATELEVTSENAATIKELEKLAKMCTNSTLKELIIGEIAQIMKPNKVSGLTNKEQKLYLSICDNAESLDKAVDQLASLPYKTKDEEAKLILDSIASVVRKVELNLKNDKEPFAGLRLSNS